MRRQARLSSARVFVLLSFCVVLLSPVDGLDDSSASLSNLYLDSSFGDTSLDATAPNSFAIASDFDPSTSDNSQDMFDPIHTGSSNDLPLQQPESDLLLSSNAACSFDSSSIDEDFGNADADLSLFEKRGA